MILWRDFRLVALVRESESNGVLDVAILASNRVFEVAGDDRIGGGEADPMRQLFLHIGDVVHAERD